jgi:hypothetical protein
MADVQISEVGVKLAQSAWAHEMLHAERSCKHE